MKKLIMAATAILVAMAGFAQTSTTKKDLEFQKYIAKKISYTNFSNEDVQGVMLVKMNVTPSGGLENINIVSGINSKIDAEVLEIIKNTPLSLTGTLSSPKAVSMVLPVRFIIEK